jgi:hypothetical protein
MSKKSNTVIFLLAATVVNIIITVVIFLGLLVLYATVFANMLPKEAASWVLLLDFVISIVGSFFIYRLAVKLISKRWDFDKYFDPLFAPKSFRKKND